MNSGAYSTASETCSSGPEVLRKSKHSPGKNREWPNATSRRESKPTTCSRPPIAFGSGFCSEKTRSWCRFLKTCKKLLAPFYVLKNEDWTRLNLQLNLLNKARRERLLNEVNEVLFLWIAEIDESLESAPDSKARTHLSPDGDPVGKALMICNKALVWVEPREPWLAMVEWLKRHQTGRRLAPGGDDMPVVARHQPPLNVNKEDSALASFQWGVLAMRERRLGRAIDWLRRATQLKPGNHWYQFFLAYLEDQAHATDQALSHYTAALVLRPESPWVLFSRAKIYRAMGQWNYALEDMRIALEKLSSRPEAARVHLEMGYLYYEVGDFARARAEYTRLIQLDGSGPFSPAARLNLANMDAESGGIDRAASGV